MPDRPAILGAALVIFGVIALAVGVGLLAQRSAGKADSHVLTVVASSLTGRGGKDAVTMQEFNTQQSCLYALGFIKGTTDTVIVECLKK